MQHFVPPQTQLSTLFQEVLLQKYVHIYRCRIHTPEAASGRIIRTFLSSQSAKHGTKPVVRNAKGFFFPRLNENTENYPKPSRILPEPSLPFAVHFGTFVREFQRNTPEIWRGNICDLFIRVCRTRVVHPSGHRHCTRETNPPVTCHDSHARNRSRLAENNRCESCHYRAKMRVWSNRMF